MPTPSLEGQPGSGRRAVGVFVAYLAELPLASWVEAARRRPLIPKMTDAERSLQFIVRQLDHHRDEFATRDAVLAALQRFECAEGRHLTRTRLATEHLRPATEHAALAVLVRPRLSADEFATLYAPFEPVIPIALLIGLPV